MEYAEMARQARQVKELAYAPYSRFQVGACLLAEDGTVYTGVNVENASYGLTVCAERIALFKAVSEGKRSFQALAIAGSGEGFIVPCGACLQVMQEFSPQLTMVLTDADGSYRICTLPQLLPLAFGLSNKEG